MAAGSATRGSDLASDQPGHVARPGSARGCRVGRGGGGGVGYHQAVTNNLYGAATQGGGQGGVNTGSDTLGGLRGYNGTDNTGGGGGGAGGISNGNVNSTGGTGGSGIVIVRWEVL